MFCGSNGLLHEADVVANGGSCLLPIFFRHPDDGGSHNSTVGFCGHLCSLFRRGNAKSDGHREIRAVSDDGNDSIQIRGDAGADAGDAQRRDQINESAGFPGNHADPVRGGRRDQRDQIYVMRLADVIKFPLFFIGNIRQDQTVDAGFLAESDKAFCAIGIDHVGMPSVRDRYSNALTASSSVTGTYSARPMSESQACSGPMPG